ncbi:hypothetical protein DSM43518_04830 [Mycobacterium marinum]|uniref:Uncharacterized protein n=1 Tax=Mycobacterium marinum TaxID=1781 RepID=A0A2Z5YIZ2_MYCMR|nr:hypothetical protein [Mycobacterium marinum]AXN43418.1 hypothetical protein MM1218R_01470 [Mycobacterium marinum]AXN51288.1 hypothetical protein CCUG20998_03892 [Mycobacterium marinum]RFZ02843.1 hypothetical protein DSM43518_04830 [Mycobacterium marinum]RFZ11529.1 hypothetical protein DE4381_01117 [Mycobacterium marinum]RFZ26034.1 hypothetical protein DSM43519_01348 [Mycobacterium marinum]
MLLRIGVGVAGRVIGAAVGYGFGWLCSTRAVSKIDCTEAWERRGDAFRCDGRGEPFIPRPRIIAADAHESRLQ